MQFIDSHAHLYDVAFSEKTADYIQHAKDKGVVSAYLPNCNSETIPGMMLLAEKYPDFMKPMMGLHPCYVNADYQQELTIVEEWLAKFAFAAIGEIGLDYYWDTTFVKEQQIVFETQIDWAKQMQLPINIHTRSSIDEGIATVAKLQNGNLKGIFHCFGGTIKQAQQIVDLGFMLGIGGVVTFKNSDLKDVLQHISLNHVVLETDAPYLAPVPFRGKQNESAYIPLIAEKLATIYQCGLDEIATITTKNVKSLYAF